MSDNEGNRAPTPEALRSLLDALRLNYAEAGRLIGLERSTVWTWATGAATPPAWFLVHLRLLLALRDACSSVFGASVIELPERLRPYRLSPEWNDSEENVSTARQRPEATPTLLSLDQDNKCAMTAEEFVAALARIGWRQADFARRADCGANTVSGWANGKNPVPRWVRAHLALVEQVKGLQQYTEPPRERKPRSGL